MPLLGLGTGGAFWRVPGVTDRADAVGFGYPHRLNLTKQQLNREACVRAVLDAFAAGFRGVDIAQDYGIMEPRSALEKLCGELGKSWGFKERIFLSRPSCQMAKARARKQQAAAFEKLCTRRSPP